MSNSIKLEVSLPTVQDTVQTKTTAAKAKKTQLPVQKVEDILTGPTNPLYTLQPPSNTVEVQNLVLVQAQDIKTVLEKISFKDPTARLHSFPYEIAPENLKLLHDNGFKTHVWKDGSSGNTFTEVSWDDATKWFMSIPIPV